MDKNPNYVTIKMFDRDALEWAAKLRSIQVFFEKEGIDPGDIDLGELIEVLTIALTSQSSVKRCEIITAKTNG